MHERVMHSPTSPWNPGCPDRSLLDKHVCRCLWSMMPVERDRSLDEGSSAPAFAHVDFGMNMARRMRPGVNVVTMSDMNV